MLLLYVLLLNLSSASLLFTLSGKALEASTKCMSNRHPCIPETLDCSEKIYQTSINFLLSIKQLLTIIDDNYASVQGSYKSFPAVQSAALIPKASTYLYQSDSPDLARFWTNINGLYPGWIPKNHDLNQYFQVGSSFPVRFERMLISGRYEYAQFITSFKITYSLDGLNWVSYKNQIFKGNTEYKEPVEHIFTPFIARSVRIIPVTWYAWIGAHFEFYVSQVLYSKSLPEKTLIQAVASGFKITASSIWDNSCGVFRAGYDYKIFEVGYGSGSWCSAFNDQNQWLMITSLRNVLWKRIGTMGDSLINQRVNSYYLTYTTDGNLWIEYKNKKIFQANNDTSTSVEYDLDEFEAIAIRFNPWSWTSKICMRVEAYCIEI